MGYSCLVLDLKIKALWLSTLNIRVNGIHKSSLSAFFFFFQDEKLFIPNLLGIFIIPSTGAKRWKTEKNSELKVVELKPISLWMQLL